MSVDLIPFQIETQRVIQLLAKQIYQSPLALLRENTQNAFDALRQRLHQEPGLSPRIDITLEPGRVVVKDNGIGMTSDDLTAHYWTAGKSSKNTPAARAAGVVGTFGIGAMANFGVADILIVETESAITGERTICRADRTKLSLKEDCIERQRLEPSGSAGTTITAEIASDSRIDVRAATEYIAEFVGLVDIPVYVNDGLVSRKKFDDAVAGVPEAWRKCESKQKIGDRLTADVLLIVSNNADIWLRMNSLIWLGQAIPGRILLRSGMSVLRTYRSGFGLAAASVASAYQLGGVADLMFLEPTAGREALTVDGLQHLQSMMGEIDSFVSENLSLREEADSSTPFMNWVVSHKRFDLCGNLKMSVSPGERISLHAVGERSKDAPMMLYEGSDAAIIKMHASDESPLLVLARTNPRRKCEEGYLARSAKVERISDQPVVRGRRGRGQMSTSENGLAYRLESILDTDYFLSAIVDYGVISHGLPVLAEKTSRGVRVTLNPEGQTVRLLLGLYEREYQAFGSMSKDFVRNVVFPRIADYVPSSTRQGAEAFLKAIRRSGELFEYADGDLGSLPKIWSDYDDGLISMEEAVALSKSAVRSSVQFVEAAEPASNVVADVMKNEEVLRAAEAGSGSPDEALPGISRLDSETSAKLLVIAEDEPALRGYRCFLAISDKTRETMGEFFLQPHRTSIVWGGQKTVFIFQHHSGQFGLYYDLQTREPVDAVAGGGPFPTSTIVLRNRIFIPIPAEIASSFIPAAGERKRFEVRADILRTDTNGAETQLEG